MSAFCFRKLICQATRNEMNCLRRYFGLLLAQTMIKTTLPQLRPISFARRASMTIRIRAFSSSGDAAEEEKGTPERKKKKDDPSARTFGSIGRKIPHRLIHVISESGEDLGTMHRADVIRIMDERGLKLVPVRENADTPVYQLMTGKQIHEEQLKHREMKKAKPKTGPTQIKELTFSVAIAKHDLETKRKQIQLWLEKKHHVRITVQKGSTDDGTDKQQILDRIVDSMPETATFVSKPKLIKDGKAMMCVLRPTSEKELHEYKQKQKRETLKDVSPSDKESGLVETSSSMVLRKGEEIN
ncbi:translation initiation factor IF-3, mitochondrial [Microcaecilia unicolor]|uniref:Translation initiation factor IF-3, mitochondrial n=1 Tax=Microcaecilia unicolor TaxID=1415580 RepID=A0A6P7XLB3_9AMPH|nr:translation initiation factor IF-3, mitochondrial [Microcaecilia unicolor]XP_030056191.1 translation initiation factor IF-3, mitochondrial [Microcaecilia unicolor]XP_030056192.1 translation initiation factor IF-3, mitochondrial [Microcaecilia unicolor]